MSLQFSTTSGQRVAATAGKRLRQDVYTHTHLISRNRVKGRKNKNCLVKFRVGGLAIKNVHLKQTLFLRVHK